MATGTVLGSCNAPTGDIATFIIKYDNIRRCEEELTSILWSEDGDVLSPRN